MNDELKMENSNEFQNSGTATEVVTSPTISPKSRLAAALLSFFLGSLGIHRFYAGKIGTGIFMLILFIFGFFSLSLIIGIFPLLIWGIWDLIDFIMIIAGIFKDKDGLPIKKW